VVAEETAHATGEKNGKEPPAKRAEIAGLAREGAEAFIDAQKKLLDIAAQQMAVQMKVTRRTVQAMNPLPSVTLADVTRRTVDSFVSAQKALLDVMTRPAHQAHPPDKPKRPPRKAARRHHSETAAATV
jgi:hypothetical protein